MLKASERSGVAPFMAMDVLAAAARLEAAGRRIIHMEVGQPGAPAPAAVMLSRVGITNAPAALRIAAKESLFCCAYASST